MEKNEIQEYLYENIPLTKLMEIRIQDLTDSTITLSVPLAINKNHKGTAFGGSLATVVTTACWLMAFKHFKPLDSDCHIVIGKSEINYKLPVTNDFICTCSISDEISLMSSKETFLKNGKTKIKLEAFIKENSKTCVEFSGMFFIYK